MATICRAEKPSCAKVGTRSRNAMSSSIVIGFAGGLSWDELITAGLGHQDFRRSRILLDLLAEPVNVCFQGMGRHAGIISPHFLQQHLARYGALAGAEKKAQNRGFLFGKPHLVALGTDQKLGARLK